MGKLTKLFKMQIKKRIFVVGVPRSGTTLVQSILNTNKNITCYPESHFFRLIKPNSGNIKKNSEVWNHLEVFTKKINDTYSLNIELKKTDSIHEQSKYFIDYLDSISKELGKKYWSEKTPSHIQYIPYIEEVIENPTFIHVARNPFDTVASLYDVCEKYPKIWGGKKTTKDCCDRWNQDIEITVNCLEKQNHHLLIYERIINEKDLYIKKFLKSIGLRKRNFNINDIKGKNTRILFDNEAWKENNKKTLIENKLYHKFETLFNNKQKSEIYKLIRKDLYEKLIQFDNL